MRTFANDLEGEVLDIGLDFFLGKLATNQSLDVENCPVWVVRELILGGVADKSLLVGEGDPGRCDTITLVIDEDVDFAILHDTNAGVLRANGQRRHEVSGGVEAYGCAQINTDNGAQRGAILERFLVVGADSGGEKEGSAEDEEDIEGG